MAEIPDNQNRPDVVGVDVDDKGILATFSQLRAFDIDEDVHLPQIVVVGDQCSGKSSLLWSLTGYSFPQASGKSSTLVVTRITCYRCNDNSVGISISPDPDTSDAAKMCSERFNRERRPVNMNSETLTDLFEKAVSAMDNAAESEEEGPARTKVLEHMLKIEIRGPNYENFTIIEVPGIGRNTAPGDTATRKRHATAMNTVKRYMEEKRSIILAVMPCNADTDTQDVLKLARNSKAVEERTICVLTKPDLVNDQQSQEGVVAAVVKPKHPFPRGYFLVKNRGGSDDQGKEEEEEFFRKGPWNTIPPEKAGFSNLKEHIMGILTDFSKRKLGEVRDDIEDCYFKLQYKRVRLRSQVENQDELRDACADFSAFANHAINGTYGDYPVFEDRPGLKLGTQIVNMRKEFNVLFHKHGHKLKMAVNGDDGGGGGADPSTPAQATGVSSGNGSSSGSSGRIQGSGIWPDTSFDNDIWDVVPELNDILEETGYQLKNPTDPLLDWVQRVCEERHTLYTGSGHPIVKDACLELMREWEHLALKYTSFAIARVHATIKDLLRYVCKDSGTFKRIWGESALVSHLKICYRRAMEQTRLLLDVERNTVMLVEHDENELEEKRTKPQVKLSNKPERRRPARYPSCWQIQTEVLAYYGIARKRFLDDLYFQIVDCCLLNRQTGPFSALDPEKLGIPIGELDAIIERRTQLGNTCDDLVKFFEI